LNLEAVEQRQYCIMGWREGKKRGIIEYYASERYWKKSQGSSSRKTKVE